MQSRKSTCLEIEDNGETIAVVLFKGKDHTFYRVERCGLDELENLTNKLYADKKI